MLLNIFKEKKKTRRILKLKFWKVLLKRVFRQTGFQLEVMDGPRFFQLKM